MLDLSLSKDTIVTEEKDSLGSGKFTFDTGVYTFKVKQMYPSQNKGGSWNMQLVLETPEGRVFNPSIYYADKNGSYETIGKYGDNKGKKVPTIGYNLLDRICKMATDKPLAEIAKTAEKKTVTKPFDKNEKISVDMLMGILGSTIQLGLEERRVNKQAADHTGKWINTAEERFINEIVKVFNSDGLTSSEIKEGKTTPDFKIKWLEEKEGKLVDKYVPVQGSTMGTSSSAAIVDSDF